MDVLLNLWYFLIKKNWYYFYYAIKVPHDESQIIVLSIFSTEPYNGNRKKDEYEYRINTHTHTLKH